MSQETRLLDGSGLTPAAVSDVARRDAPVRLTDAARERNASAFALADQLVTAGVPVYGRNTGVGALLDQRVDDVERSTHAHRLLRSHAGGAGPLVHRDIARALLVVRINQIGAGGAGVSPALLDAMVDALNADLAPAVHEVGSVGTGDITAMAEAGLAVLGEGRWIGEGMPPVPPPLDQGSAIALISSNAATLGEAALACHETAATLRSTEAVAALSFTAVAGNIACLDARVQAARPHPGQIAAGAHLRELIGHLEGARLQDPFCYRCLPQVQGAARDALTELQRVLDVELNAASENPLLHPETGESLPSGNFHEGRLALTLDQLRAALVQAASQSAQRLSTLMDARFTGLPPFLAAYEGVSSGGMILEYTANAALEELRAVAHPVSLGITVLSRGLENHASFASLGARQLTRALDHYLTVVSAELIAAVRALRMADKRPATSRGTAVFHQAAEVLSAELADRELSSDLLAASDLLRYQPLN